MLPWHASQSDGLVAGGEGPDDFRSTARSARSVLGQGRRGHGAGRMVVPAWPARIAAASDSAPIAAGRPVARAKRMHASTLGPIEPAGNVIADSAPASIAWIGWASGVP